MNHGGHRAAAILCVLMIVMTLAIAMSSSTRGPSQAVRPMSTGGGIGPDCAGDTTGL
jgi:hypothetical protein